ncbi:MAG: phosphoglycerate dehydrogenase [Planctomycetota bacterium]
MKQRRILVADDLSAEGLEILRAAGEVEVKTGMNEDALRETLPSFHALVVRSATQVTARSLELADQLALIGRAGIGVDNIDVEAATARGIVVMNTPEANATTTGELAISLMLSLARNIAAADASMKQGKWEKSRFVGVELTGKTLGVLGLGRIGRVVAERGRGLQMQVLAYDPHVDASRAPGFVRMASLDELLAESDFVTVHVPKLDETHHLLNRDRLFAMKQGARLIHAARGGIVEEAGLCDALDAGHLAGAALDVFEKEPLAEGHRLLTTPNLVLTPHIGASTQEAKRNVSLDVANQVVTCLQRGIALNGVNVPRIAPGDAARVSPFVTLCQNLASFLAQVFAGPIESMRLTLQGELPASAARPLTAAMLAGALQHRTEGPVTQVNAEAVAQREDVRQHTEVSTLKRDFVHLIRVEALIGGERHFTTGTVLGHNHGRMIEFDDFLLDAIPEGPLLLTFHRDSPGVVGAIGTVLGQEDINVSRLQLAAPLGEGDPALGIWNLGQRLSQSAVERLRSLDSVTQAHRVD